MEIHKFNATLKKAREGGENDTHVSQVLNESALLFVESVPEELTDDESEILVNAYCDGFIGASLPCEHDDNYFDLGAKCSKCGLIYP